MTEIIPLVIRKVKYISTWIAKKFVDTVEKSIIVPRMAKKTFNRTELAKRLKAMRAGDQFTVETARERTAVNQLASDYRRAGFLELQIITKAQADGKFLVFAAE